MRRRTIHGAGPLSCFEKSLAQSFAAGLDIVFELCLCCVVTAVSPELFVGYNTNLNIYISRPLDKTTYLKTLLSRSTRAPTYSRLSQACWPGPAPCCWGCCRWACRGRMIGSNRACVALPWLSPCKLATNEATASVICNIVR